VEGIHLQLFKSPEMAPTTPVSNKKARGLAALKNKEPLPIDTEEFAEEFRSIEKDLNDNLLGHVKVNVKNMTFKWSDGENRTIADEARSASLRDNMRHGVFRSDPMHRMSGIVDAAIFRKHVQDPKGKKPASLEQVKDFNKNVEFPIFTANVNVKIEMQSGQHRMKILTIIPPVNDPSFKLFCVGNHGLGSRQK